MSSVEVSRYREAGSGAGVADEVENLGVTVQRLGRPVLGDFGEQAVLDGIPFGCASGVVSNGNREAKTVAELALQFGFPSTGTATVTAAGIGKDEQLATAMVAIRAVALPPVGDGVAAKAAVSCETPTKTEPRLASRS